MAEEKKIPLILDVQGAKAIKTIGELKKGIADTRKELEKTEVGTKRFNELSESVKAAEGQLSKLNKQSVALKDMGGPIGAIAMGFDNAKTAILRGVAAVRTLTGALAATGIGLLLVAFGSLMAYFKGTEEGAQRLRVIMAVLGAATDKVKDVFIDLGKRIFETFSNPKQALIDLGNLIKENITNRIEGLLEFLPAIGKAIKLAFAGDFAEAGKVALDATAKMSLGVENLTDKIGNAGRAIADFAKEVAETAKAGGDLERALNAVLVKERELRVERAETNKEIVKQKQLAKDISLSLEERIAALTKANEIEDALLQKELANERERLRIMEAKAALAHSDEETLNAIADQQIKVANTEQASLMKRLELGEQLNSLRAQEAAAEKARADEKLKQIEDAAAKELELRRQLRDSEINRIQDDEQQELERNAEAFQRRMDEIIGESEVERELRNALLEERLLAEQEIIDKYAKTRVDKEKAKNKELADADKALFDAKVKAAQAVGSALGALSAVIQGESEAAVAARKTLAIAEIAISTAVAIAGAIKTATSGSSSPWEMIAGIAAGVATVIANIATATQILNTANVGGGSAPAPPSAASVTAPVIAPVTTNTTQLGNTEQAELQPIQAYVVETQITGSQGNVNQIESQATFGGG
jgi:hypothetical protein